MFDTLSIANNTDRIPIHRVAVLLRNTPTICRKCYIHPEILTAYVEGSLVLDIKGKIAAESREDTSQLSPEEAAVSALLQSRLTLTLEDKLRESAAQVRTPN